MRDTGDLDGLGLADLVRSGQVSAEELLEQTLGYIEERNPGLNAVVTPLYDQAREAVRSGLPEGPFCGVPYAFKELVVSVVGSPTTAASRLLADNMPANDSEIVARCRRAGLVVLGRTNSSEFGLSAATEPVLFGKTYNPWRRDVTPGGSSGGSAAAVASGMLPMAHATDGGGSIRIPASCCGLFGLKPSRARITAGPEGGEGLAGLAHQHALTRTVRDSAALLDVAAGAMPGDPYAAHGGDAPFLDQVGVDPGRLRIAYSTASPTGSPIDKQVASATISAAKLCEELGHHVEEAAPEYNAQDMQEIFATIFQVHTLANILRANQGEFPEDARIEPMSRAIAERGREVSATDYVLRLHHMHRETRQVAKFFGVYDLWLTPTLAQLPQPLGFLATDGDDVDGWMNRLTRFTPFTYLANMTGQPAMSVPLYQSSCGLPVGVHFMARSGEEGLLFRLASQLEQACPWRHRKPDLHD